jgi:hypothetical protein
MGAATSFRGSVGEGQGDKTPIIEMGRIVSVDSKNWLVDVFCEFSGREYKDIQMASPYFHYNNGEGFYVMPEIGAQCIVAALSDANPPVILGFTAVLEEMQPLEEDDGKTTGELEDEDLTAPPTDPEEEDKAAFSFANGRPLVRPGDHYMRTRDGNFVVLRRGGVVQIGSTPTAQTIFMPVESTIRSFAQNYELELLGGRTAWEVVQEEDGSSSCINTFTWREYAEQANVSAVMRIGDLDENFFRLYMVINGIDAKTLEYTETPPIEITISKEGDIVSVCKNYTLTVEEDRTIEVGGKETENFGSLERTVGTNQTLKFKAETREGDSSTEKLKSKTIIANSITLGGGGLGGVESAVKGETLIQWLKGHTHPVAGALASAPDPLTTTLLDTSLTDKLKIG